MRFNITKSLIILSGALAAVCLFSACGDSKKEKELAAIDAAIAANQYQAQRFNSDAANVNRFAEGFAKGYEGDVAGIVRDAAATYTTAEQLAENDRQLRAYRQQVAGQKKSGGFPTWLLIGGAIVLINVVSSAAKKKL